MLAFSGRAGRFSECEIVFPQPDMDGLVEPLLDKHEIVPKHGAGLYLLELDPLVLELYREIIPYPAMALDGEGRIKIFFLLVGQRPVQVALLCRDDTELCIELRDEDVLQESVRFRDGRYISQTQFLHEPVLECGKQAFDPSFRLGTVRGYELDAQCLHHPLELGHEPVVVHGTLVVDLVRAELVEIDGKGLAVLRDISFPEGRDLDHALALPEFGAGDRPFRIVDRCQETAFVGTVLEPALV